MSIYRRIYEQHFGAIPKDEDGRSYEIHHIDGNRSNNNIENLMCVSIKKHYAIHYLQRDWAECMAMAIRMQLTPIELSECSSKAQQKRLKNGTHNFLDFEFHSNREKKKIESGTHNFSSEQSSQLARSRVKNGTHNFLGNSNPLSKKIKNKEPCHIIEQHICPHCGKEGKGPMMKRWHFSNCKFIDVSTDNKTDADLN